MNALVRIEGERVLADSRDVCDQFTKRHDNVLRAIDTIIRDRPELALNFEAKFYPVQAANGASRSARRFDMDRKGFMLLVMGFQGAKALEIKSKWIDAFDAMERTLTLQAAARNDDEEAPEPLPDMAGTLMDYNPALSVIREARHVFGRRAAQQLWTKLGLPDVNDHVPGLEWSRTRAQADMPQEMKDWMAQCTRMVPGAKEKASELYYSYCDWCRDMSLKPETHTAFGRRLQSIGLTKLHSGVTWRVGLELNRVQ